MRALKTVLTCIEVFRTHQPDMPIQQAAAVCIVAMAEGLTIRELANRLGCAQSSAGRVVLALTREGSKNRPGLELITTKPNPHDGRSVTLHLTPKGRALVQSLQSIGEIA